MIYRRVVVPSPNIVINLPSSAVGKALHYRQTSCYFHIVSINVIKSKIIQIFHSTKFLHIMMKKPYSTMHKFRNT